MMNDVEITAKTLTERGFRLGKIDIKIYTDEIPTLVVTNNETGERYEFTCGGKATRYTKVAVYGTLRKGGSAHHMLDDYKLLWEGKLKLPYTMYAYAYPALIPNKDLKENEIYIEVYEIPHEKLAELDWYEGYPRLYNRIKINTPVGKAWLYVVMDEDTIEEIKYGGNWYMVANGDFIATINAENKYINIEARFYGATYILHSDNTVEFVDADIECNPPAVPDYVDMYTILEALDGVTYEELISTLRNYTRHLDVTIKITT